MKKTIKYLQDGEYHYATVKDVGDLEQLKTQHKEDLVTALNELFTTGGDSKTNGYDDLVKKVSDTRTSLNGVNSEVSNVKNRVNNLQTSSRNYIKNSQSFTMTGNGTDNYDLVWYVYNDAFASNTYCHGNNKTRFSFYLKPSKALSTARTFRIYWRQAPWTSFGTITVPAGTTDTQHYELVMTTPTSQPIASQIFMRFMAQDTSDISYTITKSMLTIGDSFPDWTPAPEDTNSAIEAVSSKIDQTADGINNTITDINGKVVANDEAIAQAKKDLQDALTQFQTFNDEIEQAKKDAETKLADAKQALKDEFNNNLADAQKANQKQLEDKIAVIQGNLDTTSNTLNDVKTQLANAKLDYGNVNVSIQKLNDMLATKLSSTDLDPLKTSIQNQESEIQQTKDSIATKTSKAEFDVLSGRVGNAEAKIEQQADEISLGVKKSELNGAIDNYQIEGANRLRNTIDFDIDGGYWKLDQYDIKSTADVHPYDQAHDVSALVLQKTGSAKQDVDFTNEDLGQNFVVSMWNKKDAQPQVWYGNTQLTNRQVAEIKGDYERSFFTFIPTNVNVKTIMFKYDAGTVDQLVIGEPKLELGTKPKAYAPNPNDEHKQIVDTKAELKIASDKIESTVEKQTKTDDNINQLSSRITQTEQGITATNDLITKTKDGLIKDYTGKIDASAKSLSSEFDEKTDEKIGQITDSGENLILNSAFTNETDRKDKWQNISDKVNIVADNNGLMWAHMSQTGLTADNPIGLTSNYFPIKQGKITVGVDIKSDNTNGLSGAKILVLQTYNANKQRVDFTEISLENMGLTIQQLAAGESHRGVYRLGNDRSDAVYMTVKAVLPRNGSIYFTNFSAKLSSIDNGGYTPNADDLKRQILNQKTKIEQNSQQITLKASSTELRDVQTIANGAVSVANQANSNANTANTNATNAVSVANNANNNANQAKSNANSAVTTANNAKSTADNANNSANNAVNTANTANNKVTAIQANGGGVNLAKGTDKFLESTTSYGAASIGGLTPEEWKQYEGKTLTFSITIEWKNWQTYGNNRVGWELAFHVGGKAIWDNDKSPHLWISGQANGSSGKKRLSTTITVPDNIDGDSITGQVAYIQSHADYFKISDLMVEEGTVAHTWSPAPEDIQTQIDQARTDIQSTLTVANNGITAATNLKTTYDNYVQKNDANIKLLGDRITNEVSKITSNGGGVNLLQGTGTVSGDVASGGGAIVKGAFNGYDAVKTNGAWDERYINLKSALGRTDAKAGDWYTISVYVKADKQIDTGSLLVPRALGSAAYANDGFLPSIWMKDRPITTQWQQYSWSFQINDVSLQRQNTRIEYDHGTGDNWIYWGGWMLEKGIVAHDWQPAPEDTQSQIEAVSSKIDQTATSITSTVNSTKQDLQGQIDSANTKITQTADSITEQLKSYSKTGDMQNYVNTTVQKTADGINTKVSGVESKVDSTKQDLQGQITQTANDINGKVSGVENKVDNASSKINDITSNGGGRNLWVGSKSFQNINVNSPEVDWNTDSDGIATAHITGTGGFYGAWQSIYANHTDPFAIGDSGTFSIEMKGTGTITIGRENDFWKDVTLTDNWTRYSISGEVKHRNSAYIIYNESGKDCDAYVRLPMVEKGTIAHDWQPAPEDTQSQIDANKTSAANAHTSADNANTTANSALTKADSAVSVANQANTNASSAVNTANTANNNANQANTNASSAVNTANTANTTANSANSNANQAVTKASNAVNTANTANTNASSAVSVANNANITANTANSNANSANNTANSAVTTANSAVNTANNANTTANQANSKVAAIQANGGGRNLLIGSDPTLSNRPSLGGVTEANIDGVKAWHSNNADNIFFNISLDANTTYTYSALIKADDAGELGFSCYGHFQVRNPNAHNQADPTHEDITSKRDYHGINVPANQWIRIYYTFTTNDLDGSTFGVFPSYAGHTVYVRHLMLEKGTVAHDWSPAPEDVDAKITTNSTAIEQNKKAIALKADQTTVDQTNGTVQQLQAQLKVQADQINSKVSSSDLDAKGYATQGYTQSLVTQKADQWNVNLTNLKTDVNAIKTAGGGVNLLQGTRDFSGDWLNLGTNFTKTGDTYNGLSIAETNVDWYGLSQYYPVKQGETYTFSIFARYTSGTGTSSFYISLNSDPENGHKSASVTPWPSTCSLNENWNKYSFTFTVNNDGYIKPRMERTNNNKNTLQVCGFMLEEGTVAHPWSPAPSDMATVTSVTNLSASVDGIKSTVAEKISELNTKWDVANGKIEGKVTETQVNDILNGKGYATQSWAQTMFQMKSDSITLQAVRDNITDGIQNQVNGINNKIDTQTLDSADINNMKTQGHYFVKNLANSPISGWVYVDVTGNNNDRLKQDVYQDNGYEHKSRRWFGSYWTEWTTDVNNKNIVSQINITPDQIKIASNKIEIDGNTYIHGELNVSNVKLKGNNGIVDLSGDGINITKDNGAGISIANNGIQLTANTNGQNEIEGVLTTAWNLDNKNQNGIGLIVTPEQDLGKPYGGDILTIGSMLPAGIIHAAMIFDATGITGGNKGFNWFAPHTLDGAGGVLRFPGAQDDLMLCSSNIPGSRQSNFSQPTMRLVNGEAQGQAGIQIQWYDIVPFGRITSSMSYMSAVGTDGDDGLTVSWYSWPGWYGGRKVPSIVNRHSDGSRANGGIAFYPGGEVCFWQGDFRSNLRWSGLNSTN